MLLRFNTLTVLFFRAIAGKYVCWCVVTDQSDFAFKPAHAHRHVQLGSIQRVHTATAKIANRITPSKSVIPTSDLVRETLRCHPSGDCVAESGDSKIHY